MSKPIEEWTDEELQAEAIAWRHGGLGARLSPGKAYRVQREIDRRKAAAPVLAVRRARVTASDEVVHGKNPDIRPVLNAARVDIIGSYPGIAKHTTILVLEGPGLPDFCDPADMPMVDVLFTTDNIDGKTTYRVTEIRRSSFGNAVGGSITVTASKIGIVACVDLETVKLLIAEATSGLRRELTTILDERSRDTWRFKIT